MIKADRKPIKVFGESFDSILAVANRYEICESVLAAQLWQGQKAKGLNRLLKINIYLICIILFAKLASGLQLILQQGRPATDQGH